MLRRLDKKIGQLKDGDSRVDVEGEIKEVSESRTVNLRSGGQARVADALLIDEESSIKLSLWDDQIDMVKAGMRVKIENGYVRSFRGEPSLNVGRYGRLTVLD